MSTSDAIKLSREVDPNGDRTIGVLTKLDLMDKGMDARQILLNEHRIKLKRGFIGVKCRSPDDIRTNKSLSKAIVEEKTFFAEHTAYHDITDRLGIETLQKYLQNELANHLFEELPAIREKFAEKLYNIMDRIEKISIDKIKDMTLNELISNTVRQFSKNFRNEIGTGDDVPVDRKNCGTNINIEMNVIYAEALEAIVYDEERIKQEIRHAIMNIFGTRIEPYIPNKAFEIAVRKQLGNRYEFKIFFFHLFHCFQELMEKPSLKCVDAINSQLESIVKNCSKKQSEMFPKIMYKLGKLLFIYYLHIILQQNVCQYNSRISSGV